MLKRLKTNLFSSQVQKHLQRANINKTHDFIHLKYLTTLTNLMLIPKSRNQLLNILYKGINSNDNVLRIKSLIVIHACIRKCINQQLCEIINNQEIQILQQNPKQQQQKTNMNAYQRNNIVNFYLIYLKKMCINKQSYQYVKKFTKKQIQTQYTYRNELQHEQNIEIVTNGFKILNLANYLLQSQQMFNKMGRYHIEHQQIISMFIQLLEDLNLFNSYIKLSVKAIIAKNNQSKSSMEDCFKFSLLNKLSDISLDNQRQRQKQKDKYNFNAFKKDKNATSTTKAQTSNIIYEQNYKNMNSDQSQQIKHQFLYINQSQKVSDRLYQYYHNRYYYKILKTIITFPTFLIIQNKQYTKLKNKTKKVDRNLVKLVKQSKYDGENTVCYGSFNTQPIDNIIDDTMNCEQANYTQIYNNKRGLFDNFKYNMMVMKNQETVDQVQYE